jgi:hypothetical protein
LDLDGVLEVEDSFALPVNETAVGGRFYAQRLTEIIILIR